MKLNKALLLVSGLAITIFLLVYSPHYNYPFPRHIDEWHHITEAIKFQKGEYSAGTTGYRIGFHILLSLLSKMADLVVIYRFLPAIWAVFSALVLAYITYMKTGGRLYPALWAMLFFASLKSNVNITGLWFFTPLTFSIPFIYLYVYFFTEGVEKENKKLILASLVIMAVLLPVHAISVLFALPFLIIYSLCNHKYIRKEWKIFSLFLTIPLMGIIFYKFMTDLRWGSLIANLGGALQFRRGWGVLELKNSPFELYSLTGYILAAIGLAHIFGSKKAVKRHLIYALWPITLLISIAGYKITGVSPLSPYQRNLYYFAIGLPILSAIGSDYLFKSAKSSAKAKALMLGLIIFFTFRSYWDIPEQIGLYKIIADGKEYQALLFLSGIPEKSVIMAAPRISTAVYAVSGHKPVATYFFYGKRKAVERFFREKSRREKEKILRRCGVKYVLSERPINCGWRLIFNNGNYIYKIE